MAFHVPEASRERRGPLASDSSDGHNGAFVIPSPEPGWTLVMICSDGLGWEHVSVRAHDPTRGRSRVPTWKEMCAVKAVCWDDEDVVVQFHPRKSEYVNNHPHVLHLWRPTDQLIPAPATELVGVRAAQRNQQDQK